MTLKPLAGHSIARRRLSKALANGQLPQVILMTGPEGVAKQRLALWLAQLVLCEVPAEEPCGRCRPCHLVLGLTHADLHWIVPIPRPKAGEPDKQVEEAAESIAELLEERRKAPLYSPPDGIALLLAHLHSASPPRLGSRLMDERHFEFRAGAPRQVAPFPQTRHGEEHHAAN